MDDAQVLARNTGARIPLPISGDFPHFDLLSYTPNLDLPPNTAQLATLSPLVSPVSSPLPNASPRDKLHQHSPEAGPNSAAEPLSRVDEALNVDDARVDTVVEEPELSASRAASPSHSGTTRVGEDIDEAVPQDDVVAAAPQAAQLLFLPGTPSSEQGSPVPALSEPQGGESPENGPVIEILQGTFLFLCFSSANSFVSLYLFILEPNSSPLEVEVDELGNSDVNRSPVRRSARKSKGKVREVIERKSSQPLLIYLILYTNLSLSVSDNETPPRTTGEASGSSRGALKPRILFPANLATSSRGSYFYSAPLQVLTSLF